MLRATCFPLIGLPKEIFVGLVVVLVGLFVDAAVGAADGFSEVVLGGEFQWASRDMYTSWMTWPKGAVDSLNLDTHSLRSSTSLSCSHWSRFCIGNVATLCLARKKYRYTTSRGTL